MNIIQLLMAPSLDNGPNCASTSDWIGRFKEGGILALDSSNIPTVNASMGNSAKEPSRRESVFGENIRETFQTIKKSFKK
jgi:hypothetical protein